MAHACPPSTWEVEVEDQEFKAIPSYIVGSRPPWATRGPPLKKKKIGEVAFKVEHVAAAEV